MQGFELGPLEVALATLGLLATYLALGVLGVCRRGLGRPDVASLSAGFRHRPHRRDHAGDNVAVCEHVGAFRRSDLCHDGRTDVPQRHVGAAVPRSCAMGGAHPGRAASHQYRGLHHICGRQRVNYRDNGNRGQDHHLCARGAKVRPESRDRITCRGRQPRSHDSALNLLHHLRRSVRDLDRTAVCGRRLPRTPDRGPLFRLYRGTGDCESCTRATWTRNIHFGRPP